MEALSQAIPFGSGEEPISNDDPTLLKLENMSFEFVIDSIEGHDLDSIIQR